MKFKDFIIKTLKNKVGRIICIVVLSIIALLIIGVLIYNKNQSVDTRYIIATLEEASELTTAKLTYTGFSEFKDDGIAIINRSDFLMVYTAVARAGIDVKDVDVSSSKITKEIIITIPKAKILDVKVNAETIKYYDEGFALFNVNSKEDANKAQKLAEEKAKDELAKMGILKMADDQSETLIKGLIQDIIPKGYELKIQKSN